MLLFGIGIFIQSNSNFCTAWLGTNYARTASRTPACKLCFLQWPCKKCQQSWHASFVPSPTRRVFVWKTLDGLVGRELLDQLMWRPGLSVFHIFIFFLANLGFGLKHGYILSLQQSRVGNLFFPPPPRKWCIKTIRVTPFWGRPQTDHNIPNLFPIIFPLIFVFCCGTCQVHGMSRANMNAPHCLSKQLFLVFCLLGPIQKRWFKMKTLPTVQLTYNTSRCLNYLGDMNFTEGLSKLCFFCLSNLPSIVKPIPAEKRGRLMFFLMFSGGSLAEILKRFPLVGNRLRKGNKKQTHVIQVCILHDDFGI